MKFYEVNNDYINYLRKYEDKIRKNTDPSYKKTRKYIGILINIDDLKYIAPLSSPSSSDYIDINGVMTLRSSNDSKTFMYRTLPNGQVHYMGKILIHNMIPVIDGQYNLYDLDNEQDSHYKDLLQNQYKFILDNKDVIVNRAKRLRVFKLNSPVKNDYWKAINNFKLLEDVCNQYS
jgi:protein AbiQ